MLRSLYVRFYKWGIALFGGLGLHKIWPFGAIHDFLSTRARGYKTPESLTVFGNKLYLLPGDNMGLSIWGEEYERATTNLVRTHLKPGGVFLDIGANIGYFTLFAAKLVGESGRVIAFEPDPANFTLLEKNVRANDFKNVTLERLAASDAPGTISFFLSEHNAGDHCMYDRQAELRKLEKDHVVNPTGVYDQHSAADPRVEIKVPAVTLDEYVKNMHLSVDIVKIDVQGGEGRVTSGMKELLRSTPQIKLFTEFWPAGIRMSGSDPEAYLMMFEQLGFNFYLIEKHGTVAITRKALLEGYTVYNNRTAELFISRS
jgi:FkbM family methyltransferase